MNQLGRLFSVTSFGESHGAAVGCVIQGCPAGLPIDFNHIQQQVDRRKTGQHHFASPRKESDRVQVLSGVYDGKSLGSPIALLIENTDARSSDYDALKDVFRPGHADWTTHLKYGHRDHRGGGRSSIRITAPMVAAGAIAKQLLQQVANIEWCVFVSQIGSVSTSILQADAASIEASPLRCPDSQATKAMLQEIDACHVQGDTLGGRIHCHITGVPAGWGEPVFNKLQAALGHAMFSINTVKGVSFGEGFAAAGQRGSEHNDQFVLEDGQLKTISNKAGGILGGISTGEPITLDIAFKPISSIKKTQVGATADGSTTSVQIEGRHDVCAVPRAVPIVEAYIAIILADFYLHHQLHS
jgi:chorismate synthase